MKDSLHIEHDDDESENIVNNSKIKIYFVDKPYYAEGTFQYPDGSYKQERLILATQRFLTAKHFQEEIVRHEAMGAKELFILEYQMRTDKDWQGNDHTMLWVRYAFKK